MFKSNKVAKVKPLSFNNKSCIFGIGYGFLLIRLFSSLKSVINLIVRSFFGVTKVGAPHSERFTFCKMPIFTNHSPS